MARYTRELLAPYVKRIEEQAEEIGALKAQLAAATANGLAGPSPNGIAHGQAHVPVDKGGAPAAPPFPETQSAPPARDPAQSPEAGRSWWRRLLFA